jgi:hypothetical protein
MNMSPDSRGVDASGVRMRASDADRAATAEVLQDAVARGLLTHEEGGERIAAALSTRYVDELPLLTADLPPVTIAVKAVPGWRQTAPLLVTQLRQEVLSGMAGGFRSRRVLVTVLLAVLVLGALVVAGGWAVEGLFDGGPERGMEMWGR